MAIIPGILWREDYLRQGLRIAVDWDTEAAPMGCFGTTGSGKTYALKLLCGKLVKYGRARLTVCDGKGGGDFDFLKGCDRYAAIDATAVFDGFYNSFLACQRGEDESWDMFFSEYKDQMEPDRARGTGYMTVNGTGYTIQEMANHAEQPSGQGADT